MDAGNVGLIPRLERSPGEGNGNPLQYSCLGNPMDGGGVRPPPRAQSPEGNSQGFLGAARCPVLEAGRSQPLRGLEGVPGLPGAPRSEDTRLNSSHKHRSRMPSSA